MKTSLQRLVTSIVILSLLAAASAPGTPRDRLFDTDWRFLRADTTGAQQPDFNDSTWRKLDLPHDWSIEDLPPQPHTVPELEAVTGTWRFQPGDNAAWKAPDLDDSDWQSVTLPDNWEHHSDYTAENVYGWFRRQLEIPADCQGRDFDLLLGQIDDVDEVFLNGQRIGSTGSFPPNYQTAYSTYRRYRISADQIRGDGSDLLAVRVFDGNGNGGILAPGTPSFRIGPFDPHASENKGKTGHVVGGIGWYRKHFTVSEVDKQVTVTFDGVYMNAEVWLNGQRLGEHPHGYTAFTFDLTPHLNPPGQDNVLAVCVRNEGKNSRWYSGSGIYRHVWLTVTDTIHVPTWGVFVTTPQVSPDQALVKIDVEVCNATDQSTPVQISTTVRDTQGQAVGRSQGTLHLVTQETRSLERFVTVPSPDLWSPESPTLYNVEVEVSVADQVVDQVTTAFGIRSIEIDAQRGLRLNGQPLLLKGGCIHHDNGPLGSVALDRAEERKIELLKANGYNAIRSAHNPPSSALLEACDRLGMLVIDEAFDQWNESKENNAQDYHCFFEQWCEHDIAAMVRRDRNHPSVLMWSIGNEIPEQFRAGTTPKRLREAVLSHDTTRPITQGICNYANEQTDPGFKYLDVGGYNYLPQCYEIDHERFPNRVMFCTESFPKDAFEYWTKVEELPYVIGDFVWTAMDYLGESGLAHTVLSNEPNPFFMPWPWNNAWSGDLDICGFKKPPSLYRDVVWRRSPIEILVHKPIPEGLTEILSWWAWPDEEPHWNWPGLEGTPLQVSVYSRCDTVRLELNGQVIGEQPSSTDSKLTASFKVPYQPGELWAIGLLDGQVVTETTLQTTGAPQRIKLTADRTTINADRNDLAYVTVELLDAQGRRVPTARIPVHFTVTGAGELEAQGSGIPNEPASFQAPVCKTFQGRCLAILRPTGKAGVITLRAKAEGLTPATLVVRTQ